MNTCTCQNFKKGNIKHTGLKKFHITKSEKHTALKKFYITKSEKHVTFR